MQGQLPFVRSSHRSLIGGGCGRLPTPQTLDGSFHFPIFSIQPYVTPYSPISSLKESPHKYSPERSCLHRRPDIMDPHPLEGLHGDNGQ